MIYALVALGFTLIFGVAKVVFLAHGEVYMLSAIVGLFFCARLGIPYVAGLLLTVLVIGSLGIPFERLFRRTRGQDLPIIAVSTGLAMLISHSTLVVVGRETWAIPPPFYGLINIGGIVLTVERLAIIFIAVAIILFLNYFIQKTKAGQAIRATAQDEEAAILQGVDVNHSQMIIFCLAMALTGAAAVVVAPLYFVNVFLGGPALTNAFIVVILGGLGSVPGAIAGGLLLGFMESFGYVFVGGLSHLISFIAIVLLLIIRPQGLFGRE